MKKEFAKRLMISLTLLFSLLAITACKSENSPDPRRPLPLWITDWIDKPTCEQPCWENITPGVSSIDEASRIIEDRKDTENFNQAIGPLSDNQKVVYWHFVNSGGSGEIYTDTSGISISAILLHIEAEYTLEEAISKLGMPGEITVISCLSEDGPVCEVCLLYVEKGLAIKFKTVPIFENTNNTNFALEVKPEDRVTEVMFFKPGGDGYIQATKNKIMDSIKDKQKWNGYGRYVFSYQ